MSGLHPLRRRAWKPLILAILGLLVAGRPPQGLAQEGQVELPDPAVLEVQLEEAFAKVLEMSDETPFLTLQAWGSILAQAAVVERIRGSVGSASGTVPPPRDAAAAEEALLDRWQRLRPDSGGPDLFRAFRVRDPEARRAAIVALLDRYPQDPLVLSQATHELRTAGEVERATAALENFVARNPERSVGYSLLTSDARGNETRTAEVLERWAQALPGDPAMVTRWLQSRLPKQRPEATHRMLSEFFAGRPSGEASLNACIDVLREGGEPFADAARACVAEVAADPASSEHASKRATSAMVGVAAESGDWSRLLTTLDALEPQARVSALITAARELEAPARCGDRIELLTAASEALGNEDSEYAGVASALAPCFEAQEARALFLAVLREAPAGAAERIVRSQLIIMNGAWRGELPEGTVEALEGLLEQDPDAPALFSALDIAYQLGDADEKRFDLLRRWQHLGGPSFRGEQAVALASALAARDQPEEAVAVLEPQLEKSFDHRVADLLWALYRQTEGEERADRLAEKLMASDNPSKEQAGHRLAARSAVARQELGAAEAQYWKALEGQAPHLDVAVELLLTVSLSGDTARLEPTAVRICEETKLRDPKSGVPQCAADLLTRAGQADAAAGVLASRDGDLPADLDALRNLSATAQAAGDLELAERALRRTLEIDPGNDSNWLGLGLFFEKQGRFEEVADLLQRSRERFSPPPFLLARAAARALTAADQPRRAIPILLEARGALPDTEGGQWGRSWANHELREAYEALGRATAAPASARSAPAPAPAFPTSQPLELPSEATAAEIRAAAESLYSGEDGRFDPVAARELFARAASMGDAAASFRLALLSRLGSSGASAAGPSPAELYRQSAQAVESKARDGDSYAQYLVGTAALVGLGGNADYAVARRWLEAAAAQGESWAWHNLGWMEQTGKGFESPDPRSVLASYRKASAAGNVKSMVEVARLTLTPDASDAACEEGRELLVRAARAGYARAASLLGKALFYGQGPCVEGDPKTALPWLEVAASTHQPGGQYDLGLLLVLAGSGAADRERGLAILEEQVESQPDALTVETLSFLYGSGVGVPADPERASRLLEEAARFGSDGFPRLRKAAGQSVVFQELIERGVLRLEAVPPRSDPTTAALLARLYELGLAGEVDPERTVALARIAAAAGEAGAMRILSNAYLAGNGVERDEAEGLRWRRRCAQAGNSFCMMFHAHNLMEGKGVERDVQAGLDWLRRAAEAGNWWAMGDLGNLYAEGWNGLPVDPDEAVRWKRRLADLGDAEATGWLIYHGLR